MNYLAARRVAKLWNNLNGRHSLLVHMRRMAASAAFAWIFARILVSVPAVSAQTLNPPSRPIIFVHGWCGNTPAWQPLSSYLFQQLNSAFPALYVTPPAGASTNYDIYYDSSIDGFGYFDPSGAIKLASDIPPSTRLFNIRFYDSVDNSFDPTKVAEISILNKAYELSKVIKQVAAITHVKDVIVVSHSMGGLVSRAYIENMASAGQCYQGNVPDYNNGACYPGDPSVPSATYGNDVADLITVDTPHSGSPMALIVSHLPQLDWDPCYFQPTENVDELLPQALGGPGLIEALNYDGTGIGVKNSQPTDNIVPIQSVEDYLSDVTQPWDDWFHLMDGYSDDIVPLQDQSINVLQDHTLAPVSNVPYSYVSNSQNLLQTPACWYPDGLGHRFEVLHVIDCIGALTGSDQNQNKAARDGVLSQISPAYVNGTLTSINVQATLDGQPWSGPATYTVAAEVDPQCPSSLSCRTATVIPPPATFVSDWAPGFYTVSNVSGGPSTNMTLPAAFLGQNPVDWNITLTINFYSSAPAPPVVKTLAAKPVYTNDAILKGTVNPEGATTNVWFEWGTDSNLSQFQPTEQQSIPPGTTPVSVTFDQGELSSSSIYYYRIAANNGGTTQRGAPVGFVTLGALPSPTLTAPANGSTGISTTPTFSWNTVSGATSYRIFVATTPSALPTDPSSSTCGTGCVLSATPPGTTYTPASGILSGSTTYYWEVSATGSGQNGNWSGIFSFTTAPSAGNDFSLLVTPNSQSVNGSGTVGYAISTTTISGASQTIELGVGNLPTGVTALFTPNLITSGSTAIVGLTTSSSTPVGTYSITIAAVGSSTTHTATVSLSVTNHTGTPAVSFSPSSLAFSNQTLYTTGPSQLVTYTNTGTAPLQVLAIVGDSNFVVQNPCINTLPAGTSCTFSVASDPSITGPMTGTASLYFASTGSPAVLPLRGYGVAPPPTTGTIQVNGTLNGLALPVDYFFSFTLTGPATYTAGGTETFTVTPGTYTLSFNGLPSYFTLSGITPSAIQTVAAGGVITYTMNFTAPDDFYGPYFGVPQGQGWSAQFVPAGATGTFYIGDPYYPGNASVPLTLQVLGNPAGETALFNPQPMYSGGGGVLTITTNAADPVGAYSLSLNATNPEGLSHAGENTSALIITNPPSHPLQLVSQSSTGAQGNAGSNIVPGAVSADGRYVVFSSSSTNLVPSNSTGVFLRDQQTNTTTLVSVSSSGNPGDYYSVYGSISANGRFVVFSSDADNLVPGTNSAYQSIYVRDLQQGLTEREDVASDGTGANGSSSCPAISADGRFVVFESNSTNLAPGTSGNNQIYRRDRNTGQIILVSLGIDGSPANQLAYDPSVSADGRFTAYYSEATNLVPQNTGGITELYVYDAATSQTILASAAADGTPAGQWVFSGSSSPALSADGHFVAFASSATNLIPGAIDLNGDSRLFLKDLRSQAISLADTDINGSPLGIFMPQISSDGRYVASVLYSQIYVKDMVSKRGMAISLAPNGMPGNGQRVDSGFPPNINTSGTAVAFESYSTNLISNDTNNASDVFFSQNPLVQSPFAQSLAISPSPALGGNEASGYLTLSGPAPQGGATVSLSCNNSAAVVPAFVVVPAGATTMTFGINTSLVSTETVMTIIASYNGGAAVGLLTLEPAPSLSATPTSWDFGSQPVGTTSPSNAFTITNTGTAPLTLNSESIASGQVFHMTANSCGASLAVGANCSVSVVFSPTAAGSTADTLQISYSSPPVLQSVPLTGTGTTPLVSLAPTTVTFGSQLITSATPATVTLTDVGTAPLTSIAASITGANTTDFSISSDGCSGTVLQPNSGCLITVVFSPQVAGPRTASLSVNDNVAGSPQTVALTGTGSVPPPLTVAPTFLSFGNHALGSTSTAKKVTLTNKTGVVVTGISWTVVGTNPSDFQQSAATCGQTLKVKASCTISIVFAPEAVGARSATLAITDSASNSPQSVSLTGTGILPVTVSPSSLKFPVTTVGTTSAVKIVTIKNNLPGTLAISGITPAGTDGGDFAVKTTTCGLSLTAGSSCTVSVTFTPAAKGSRVGELQVADSAVTSPQTVALSGTGK